MVNRRTVISAAAALGLISTLIWLALAAQAQPAQAREEFHQTYSLSPGGQVDLSNINGKVTITAWDSNQVKVDAIKHGNDAEQLKQCRIEVSASPQALRIDTKYPSNRFGHGNNISVDYTLMVPRNARLDKIKLINGGIYITGVGGPVGASVVNGSVQANDVAGSLELSSVNGTVEVNLKSAGKPVKLSSVNGGVVLNAPSDLQAEINASTVNGNIRNNYGLDVKRGLFVGANMNGRLGSGAVRIDLSTVNGSIDLNHAADGKPLSKARGASGSSREPL